MVCRLLRNPQILLFFIIILIHKCSHQVKKVIIKKMKLLSQYYVTDTGHRVKNNIDKSCFLCLAAFCPAATNRKTSCQCVKCTEL